MNIEQMIKEMTLLEKASQCTIITPDFFDESGEITGPMEIMSIDEESIYSIGSVIGVTNQELVRKIQDKYLERSRLKIPLMFMADIIHGCQTIFPVPLALSNSFNPELIEKVASFSGKESAILGNHVTYSPMADLARDARWGRNMESNGEDPFLNGLLTAAYVKGYQGNDLKDKYKVASCVKHFAGYSNVKSGREYDFVDLSERILREFHVSGYISGINAGAKMMMTSFNTINSIPATANKWLFRDYLRDELGFDGTVISDWGAVKESINHQVAADEYECAHKSLTAGINIEMMTPTYINSIVNLISNGYIEESVIDELTKQVLLLKEELGLFNDPYRGMSSEDLQFIGGEEIQELAYDAAAQSIVLLQNNDILPLTTNKIHLAGPLADSHDMNGPWSWQGNTLDNSTLKELFIENSIKNFSESECDVIVYFGGETSNESGEAKSKTNIDFPEEQVEEIINLAQLNKKIVLLVNSGRPLVLSKVVNHVDGILLNYFLGTKSSEAIYNTLFGINNPSGKLTMSFPRSVGQCPIYYNDFQTGRPLAKAIDDYSSKYQDCENSPLFSFGTGLTYGDAKIVDIKYSQLTMNKNEKIIVNITLNARKNIETTEVVQLYIRDLVADVIRPMKELKHFKRVTFKNSIEVKLEIDLEKLMYVGTDYKLKYDLGKFEIMVGLNSDEVQKNIIELIKE